MSGEAAKLEYTTHAVHVMTEREIPVAWVEWVIDEPALRVPIRTNPRSSGSFAASRNRTTAYCA